MIGIGDDTTVDLEEFKMTMEPMDLRSHRPMNLLWKMLILNEIGMSVLTIKRDGRMEVVVLIRFPGLKVIDEQQQV